MTRPLKKKRTPIKGRDLQNLILDAVAADTFDWLACADLLTACAYMHGFLSARAALTSASREQLDTLEAESHKARQQGVDACYEALARQVGLVT